MRHANSDISALLPEALAALVLQLENAIFKLMFMTPDQGALTQVSDGRQARVGITDTDRQVVE
jgi:hypothetical protein